MILKGFFFYSYFIYISICNLVVLFFFKIIDIYKNFRKVLFFVKIVLVKDINDDFYLFILFR